MHEDDDDICGACGQRFELEFNDFSTGRYTAHCACTQKAREDAERLQNDRGAHSAARRGFKPPTIGDLLRSKAGR